MFYTMEVSPRDSSSKAPISPYVQQPTTRFSPFLVNLQFTFQTRSKFYYILDFPGKETLLQRAKSFGGTFPEPQARFYAAEILIALEELHNFGLAYNELSLDTVYVEPSGHVMLWRNFCGKFYWSKRECVCSLHGFSHGDPCNNNHEPKSDFDFQEDWRTFGSVLYTMLTGKNAPSSVTNDRYVQHLEVQFYRKPHVKLMTLWFILLRSNYHLIPCSLVVLDKTLWCFGDLKGCSKLFLSYL